ncbi:M20/M25/M40 family metallo-hydrolase [Acidianus sp. RZ1]|uniref:M20/M25/M40 family metallo-hydrolase n=1 Tax=Acidianus sp. RZ1 TaxID=1540082 RepID=UPI001490D277|nr:M20/M25/M40 family metallo-hydrolase [Acidianus sp. RZ1]NON62959.1 M20/M25/M40 family metallo-hydrolase [Acidianus sp. RZ1]
MEAKDTLIRFLRIPSISATGEGIEDTANFLSEIMKSMGIKTEIEKAGGNPVIFGEINVGSKKTILIYNHYDVQPVDPLNEWKHPPFSAIEENNRIYARGSSDNKGTLIARLFAIKDLMDKGELGVNVKFLYEGEEEIGSVHLENYIEKNKDKLKADSVLMEGSSLDYKGRPLIVLGVKGLLYVELSLDYGLKDLHSSNAPIVKNPCWDMVKVLNSLIREDGNIDIDGFYEDIRNLTEEEEELLDQYDINYEEIKKSLGNFPMKYENRNDIVKALLTYPTCNIDGMEAGYTGKGSKTIVPHKIVVKMDFRLVPDQDPYKILSGLKEKLKSIGFSGEIKVLGAERPVRTSLSSEIVKATKNAAKEVYGNYIIIPNSAGTQPMGLFVYNLGIKDAVSAIGVGDPSSNPHAPNESISLDNFYKAIKHTQLTLINYSM